ncbi:MAG: sensor histidine kinase [Nitrososphaerota archaeon]
MDRLWVRLSLAFAAVTLVAILAVAVLANRQVTTDLPNFVAQQQIIDSGLTDQLAAYYEAHGSWDGVATTFSTFRHPGGAGNGNGHGGMGGASSVVLTLADADGNIVYRGSGTATGGQLTQSERGSAIPITARGATVGYLEVTTPQQASLTVAAQQFLGQVNQSLLYAGLIAGVVGLLLGLAIAYRLSLPLQRLGHAAQRISQGHLEQRVSLQGPREVATLARSFNDMATSLEQGERQRQQLVADVSHELRTPITVLQGNLRALLDEVYPLGKAEIAALYDETLLLARLVEDLGELTRAETGQLRLDVRPVALGPVIERAAALFRELADEKGIALKAEIAPELPLVLADPDRTGQVVHNVLANAIRHTPAGGQITVEVAPVAAPGAGPKPTPSAAVRVSVADSGPGIAPDDLPHIFERFWRASRSRSREEGGSGLGLAIARALMEAQGGHIGVESALGSGSRFWITLPAAQNGHSIHTAHSERSGARASGGVISDGSAHAG